MEELLKRLEQEATNKGIYFAMKRCYENFLYYVDVMLFSIANEYYCKLYGFLLGLCFANVITFQEQCYLSTELLDRMRIDD